MNKIKDVLLINSYAGSLIIAAKNQKMKIRGSYEDTGHGINVQQANFPTLNYVADRKDWPKQDLSDTIVLAHPPCAAFSNQNNNQERKGTDTDAFKCTEQVLGYSMKNNCAAVAVESVPGAKLVAWKIHSKFAKKYGYNLYRIDQNAIEFGVPQWRLRFWVIYIRKDLNKSDILKAHHVPKHRTISDIVVKTTQKEIDSMPKQVSTTLYKAFEQEIEMMMRVTGSSRKQLYKVLKNIESYSGYRFNQILSYIFKLGSVEEMKYKHRIGKYDSAMVRFLCQKGYSSVILLVSNFCLYNRPLCIAEYNELMGFPRDYIWPDNCVNRFRQYLSQGVCPPVAEWILKTIKINIEKPDTKKYTDIVSHEEELIYKPSKKDYEGTND